MAQSKQSNEVLLGGAILALGAFTFAGVFLSDAIPTERGIWVLLAADVVVSVLLAKYVHDSAQQSRKRSLVKDKTLLKRYRAAVCTFFIAMALGLTSINWSMLWLFNSVMGEENYIVVKVTGWQEGSRSSCSRPEINHLSSLFAAHKALCSKAKDSFPTGSSLKIVGKSTVFGINASRLEKVQGL